MHECDNCIRQIQHGGQCYGKDNSKPCLIYEKDPKGKWLVTEAKLEVPIGYPLPNVKDKLEVVFKDVDKTIEVLKILHLEYSYTQKIIYNKINRAKSKDQKRIDGILIGIRFGYWSEENGVIQDKPKLRLVK